MALSEQLSKLAQRTKVLEDRAADAKKEARADLELADSPTGGLRAILTLPTSQPRGSPGD